MQNDQNENKIAQNIFIFLKDFGWGSSSDVPNVTTINKYQHEQLLNDYRKYSMKMKSKFTTDQF